MPLSPEQAAILGIVQGLTEFLPISSSAHLILVPWLLGWEQQSLSFDAAIHLGTVLALIAYFWRDWLELMQAVLTGLRDGRVRRDPKWRLAWLLVLGSIPAGLAGLALESTVEQLLRQPQLVAVLLILFGLVLLVADRVGSRRRDIEQLRIADALLVGLAQMLALAPGVSRSGITITAGLLVGLDRATAARFSFLLSTPITVVAALFSLRKLADPSAAAVDGTVLLVGVLSAGASGFIAIGFLLRYLQKNSLAKFVWYRLAFGTLVLGISGLGLRS